MVGDCPPLTCRTLGAGSFEQIIGRELKNGSVAIEEAAFPGALCVWPGASPDVGAFPRKFVEIAGVRAEAAEAVNRIAATIAVDSCWAACLCCSSTAMMLAFCCPSRGLVIFLREVGAGSFIGFKAVPAG